MGKIKDLIDYIKRTDKIIAINFVVWTAIFILILLVVKLKISFVSFVALCGLSIACFMLMLIKRYSWA